MKQTFWDKVKRSLNTFVNGSIDEPAVTVQAPPQNKIQSAQRAYHEAVTLGTATTAELVDMSAAIREAQKETSDAITAGAIPCRVCGNLPLGMRRGNGKYEIGCLHCSMRRVIGDTPTEAVARWNQQ
jgi:hypothetical protein